MGEVCLLSLMGGGGDEVVVEGGFAPEGAGLHLEAGVL